ncbi:hypothetical protein CLV98_106110 [Dyadobacter jejuensis]|uniref:Uncharacterized protein n=1 Tax=Dyadobacter jejuensis TaxID=1082580 RepID=A0A316AJW1_9BACT|nr:hypothetical protein CLV98_106110 [Dyadobacter jejuensis]
MDKTMIGAVSREGLGPKKMADTRANHLLSYF